MINWINWCQWNAGSTNQAWYAYDASGERTIARTITSSGTNLTVYAFGLEEHVYNGTGSNVSNTYYYYTLGGRLIGKFDGTNTQYYLTDAQGSVLTTFSNAVNTTSVSGYQAYGPYGNTLASSGSMGTAKGFTGQYQDPSGLDYYNARYYDPAIGRFTSADVKQGNAHGMDPYAYVEGNPETFSDPTGHCGSWDWGCYANVFNEGYNSANKTISSMADTAINAVHGAEQHVPGLGLVDSFLGVTDMLNDFKTMANGSIGDKLLAGVNLAFNVVSDVTLVMGAGEIVKGAVAAVQWGVKSIAKVGAKGIGKTAVKNVVSQGAKDIARVAADACGGGLSFAFATKVATAQGERSIGSLNVGQKVWSYNQQNKKMELQPILHVWINHDDDLVDLTVASTVPGKKGQADQQATEVIHTNKKHPFLTQEAGFVAVADLNVGMHLVEADGNVGVITGWTVVPGTMTMYNLEVAQDHTFTVGDGQWVVHNNDCGNKEQVKSFPDAQSAFKYAMEQIGGPLSEDATTTQARGIGGDRSVKGLNNGLTSGEAGWRLDYDEKKGLHFNWYNGKKKSGGPYGAAKFPASYEDYIDMLLKFGEGGIKSILDE